MILNFEILLLSGMPSPTLNLPQAERLQAISFFLVVIFLTSLVVKFCWNSLVGQISRGTKLTYWQSLLATVLWGLMCVVVLTMISGARELMTPGAWERTGLTYRLAKETPAVEISPEGSQEHLLTQRLESLRKLQSALLRYTISHDGKFPESTSELPEDLWLLPTSVGGRYLYFPGRVYGSTPVPVVVEPQIDEQQWVIMSNGELTELAPDVLSNLVQEGK